jgi:hypothetical protein
MSEPRKTSSIPWIGVAVAMLLLAGYVVAYYGTVAGAGRRGVAIYHPLIEQSFRRDNVRAFFAPMHWLDRRLHPHFWNR